MGGGGGLGGMMGGMGKAAMGGMMNKLTGGANPMGGMGGMPGGAGMPEYQVAKGQWAGAKNDELSNDTARKTKPIPWLD